MTTKNSFFTFANSMVPLLICILLFTIIMHGHSIANEIMIENKNNACGIQNNETTRFGMCVSLNQQRNHNNISRKWWNCSYYYNFIDQYCQIYFSIPCTLRYLRKHIFIIPEKYPKLWKMEKPISDNPTHSLLLSNG